MLGLWIIIGAVVLLLAGAALYDRSANRQGLTVRKGGAMADRARDDRMDEQSKHLGNTDGTTMGGM